MTPREKLGLDLAREIIRFLGDVSMPGIVDEGSRAVEQRERFSRVLAQELDDETMETLRGSFAARNARSAIHGSRAGEVRRRG